MSLRVTVVGAGVVGLTTAIALAERGHRVRIKAAALPSQTTSAVAAALWYPYSVGGYRRRWAVEAYDRFKQLEEAGGFAVRTVRGIEPLDAEAVASLEPASDFWWRDLAGIDFQDEAFGHSEFSGLFAASAAGRFERLVSFNVPVIRMPDFLRAAESLLIDALGGEVVREQVEDLDEETRSADFVVNCTGWQARDLVQERSPEQVVRPVAGHVVRVAQPSRLPLVFLHRGRFEREPTYLIPRFGTQQDYVIGGTLVDLADQADVVGSAELSRAAFCDDVLRRYGRLFPAADPVPVAEQLVGFRPVRSRLRVEFDGPRLIHCYGHGGAGVTLSWGTAAEVCRLVQSA